MCCNSSQVSCSVALRRYATLAMQRWRNDFFTTQTTDALSSNEAEECKTTHSSSWQIYLQRACSNYTTRNSLEWLCSKKCSQIWTSRAMKNAKTLAVTWQEAGWWTDRWLSNVELWSGLVTACNDRDTHTKLTLSSVPSQHNTTARWIPTVAVLSRCPVVVVNILSSSSEHEPLLLSHTHIL